MWVPASPPTPSYLLNIPSCVPTAAENLDKSTLDKIRKSIDSSKIAKEYKSLKVTNKVQPDLLGGIVVDFGADKTVDMSVKNRVQKLEGLLSRKSQLSPASSLIADR